MGQNKGATLVRFAYFLAALTVFSAVSIESAFSLEKKVQVEAPFKYIKKSGGALELKKRPYRERRPSWGIRLNFAAGMGIETKIEGLKSDGTPIQIDMSMSKNFKYLSVGPEVGYFSSTLLNSCQNEINLSGMTAGLGLYLDGLLKSAYFVPFASVGVLLPSVKVETVAGSGSCEVTGEEDLDAESAVLYYRGGFLVGLNWLDKKLAGRALSDYGLQNSFLYFAARQIPQTSKIDNADVGTKMYFEYGLQLEF